VVESTQAIGTFRTIGTFGTVQVVERLERFELSNVVELCTRNLEPADVWLERFERISLFQSGGQFEQQRIVAARGNKREPERTTIQRRQRQ
jgi:hypothetical protein